MAMRQHPGVETPGYCRVVPLGRQVADDEAASGAPEHSLSGNAQTSRRRLAITRQAVRPASLKIAQPFMAGLNVIIIKSSPAGTAEQIFRL